MKILIAVANNRSELNIQFVKSLIQLTTYTINAGHKAQLTFFDNYDVPTMRNHAVRAAIMGEYDYTFFLDADMIYPHDSITRLLAHGKDVVSGFYVTRRSPTLPVHFKANMLDGKIGEEENRVPCTTGLVEQASGGFGGVLVATSVLLKMKYPHFEIIHDLEKNLLLGEDIYFFIELEKLGIKAYLDCDLRFGHIVNAAMFPSGKVKLY